MYRRIKNQERLSHEVAVHIKELIRNRHLKSGDKLPNETELGHLLGVSRPTVREAVKYLVSQNIIEIQRGKGTFVSYNPGISNDPLGLDFVLDDNLHLFLIETRLIIEPEVARLAVERASSADIDRIGRYVHEMEDTVLRHEIGMDLELGFHRSIAQGAENPVIMRIVPVVLDAIVKIYKDAPRTNAEHRQALMEHSEIYNAIKERDAERAFSAMQSHLKNSYRRTLAKHSGKRE